MKNTFQFAVLAFLVTTVFEPGFSSTTWAQNPLKPIKLESPRDTMRSFLEAMNDYRAGVEKQDPIKEKRIFDAVQCFNLAEVPAVVRTERGKEVAIFLKEVIDRVILIDYLKIPDNPNPKDPLLRWRLKDTEIVIQRVDEGGNAGKYLFNPDTVARAKEFYDRVKHLPYLKGSGQGAFYKGPWLEAYVPEWAKHTSFVLPNWKWVFLFISIFFGLLVKKMSRGVIRWSKTHVTRVSEVWHDGIFEAIEKPVSWIAACAFWLFSVHVLQISGKTLDVLSYVIQILFSVAILGLFYRLSDVLSDYLLKLTQSTATHLDDELIPLFRKAIKIFILVFGFLLIIQNLGFNVMSVFAGLGLGGLAFALAARDTCANLFGSLMILFDRPFKAGDWVVTDGIEGNVEEIGFRSTRVRTFYDSVVSVPNSVLANASIDNMGSRNFRRIKAYVGLTYDTPAKKVEAYVEGVKKIILEHPNTRKDYFHVVFNEYADSSLNVLVYFFLKVPTWTEELKGRQEIFLQMLKLAEEIGVSYAFPTQTVHVESLPNDIGVKAHENQN